MTAASQVAHRLVFDGKPSDYARLWLVTTALIFITLGAYLPWAKAAKLRFIYQHTSLDGYRFDFHGQPRRMARPTLIFGVFLITYLLASYLDPFSGFIAAVSMCLIWPPVWRAAAVFRHSQTSYRGLRFTFTTSQEQAYAHVGAPMLMFIFPLAWLGVDKSVFDLHSVWTVLSGLCLVAWLCLYPAMLWQVRVLSHGSVSFAGLRPTLRLHVKTVFTAFTPVYVAAVITLVGLGFGAVLLDLKSFEVAGKGQTLDITYYRPTLAFWLYFGAGALLAGIVLRPWRQKPLSTLFGHVPKQPTFASRPICRFGRC